MRLGALAVGATIYFGNDSARDEIAYVSDMFEEAHQLGMVTVLWCYTRSPGFKVKGADGKSTDYHASADLTGQANHLGATIKADIIKQKLPDQQRRVRRHQQRRLVLRQVGQARVHEPVRERRGGQRRAPDRPVPLPDPEQLHGAACR
jgi:DhnA family fructose-bisphosphate aldolase class Ia